MYVNQIDEIVSKIIDDFYVEKIVPKSPVKDIVDGKKKNFTEYRDKINDFIKSYIDSIDVSPIKKLINNKENFQRIIDIIKRYVAYYFFLYIAYNYEGTVKDFRNSLIQYSKLQESSTYQIKNFYDTENNYRLIKFFKIIKDCKKLLLMTQIQMKEIYVEDYKDTIEFLNNLGREYVDSYLLQLVRNKGEEEVIINVHNLIKTLVFGEIYKNQEQVLVFKILGDIEASENEFTWIEIVVSVDEVSDLAFLQSVFADRPNGYMIARSIYDKLNSDKIAKQLTHELKNNHLIHSPFIAPIVDDFLRYHRDIDRLDVDNDPSLSMLSLNKENTERNIQLALSRQNRKKKENTKIQLIVNKLDIISDLYSDNVRADPEREKDIKKLFYAPLNYRKAVSYNYSDELKVLQKIDSLGKKAKEDNEYYIELSHILSTPYFNFKDFKKYGLSLVLDGTPDAIKMLRYSDIEYISQMPQSFLDIRSANGSISDQITINMTGLLMGPFIKRPLQCKTKTDLIDIRTINIGTDGKLAPTSNGYDAFLFLMEHLFVKTIRLHPGKYLQFYHDYSTVSETYGYLLPKVIYWIYDVEKDTYTTDTYENIKLYNFQDNIRFMNAKIYDIYVQKMRKHLKKIVEQNLHLSLEEVQNLINIYDTKYLLKIPKDDLDKIIHTYLRKKPQIESRIVPFDEDSLVQIPTASFLKIDGPFKMKIDMKNPLKIGVHTALESHLLGNMTAIIEVKNIQNPPESPWLDFIRDGLKKYEGRLNSGYWKDLKMGDRIYLTDGKYTCLVVVKEKLLFKNFSEAFDQLGSLLVPIENITREDVANLYRKYFTDELVDKHGVVAVGIDVIEIIDKSIRGMKCKHSPEWSEVSKSKKKGITEYNDKLSEFITKYALETPEMDYVCRICGEILPIQKYVQDGKYDNNSQKFITNYVPVYTPLHESKEYAKYIIGINYIDIIISKKIGPFTNVSSFTGDSDAVRLYKKTLIKNTIDLFNKHNSYNIKLVRENPQYESKREAMFHKTFGIDNKMSEVIYFELSDAIFDMTVLDMDIKEVNRVKKNTLLLYIMFVFFLELTPNQIINMTFDKIGNIFNSEKYREQIFGGLYLKKNFNGTERVLLTNYPVLCHAIFITSYYLAKYTTWYVTGQKISNISTLKRIAHSIIEIINGVVLAYGNDSNSNVYALIVNKFYAQLSNVYKNNDLIRIIKQKQYKYSGQEKIDEKGEVEKKNADIIKLGHNKRQKFVKKSYKLGTGLMFMAMDQKEYQFIDTNNAQINCKTGDIHDWVYDKDNKPIHCSKCGQSGDNDSTADMNDEAYYFNLAILAKLRCIGGTQHDFPPGDNICSICHQDKNKQYSKKELDEMIANIHKIDDNTVGKHVMDVIAEDEERLRGSEESLNDLEKFIKRVKNIDVLEKYISTIDDLIGPKTNIGTEKSPQYVKDDVYVIDHYYNGTPLENPIFLMEGDGKIKFKESHPFYKTDVYSYPDRRAINLDVFYDAGTLKLIGYKEKNKEYMWIEHSTNYLIINKSLQNKITNLGNESQYIDITNIRQKYRDNVFNPLSDEEIYFAIIENLISKKTNNMISIVDKFSGSISAIKNNNVESAIEKEEVPKFIIKINDLQKKIIDKYSSSIENFTTQNVFVDWNDIRDIFPSLIERNHVDWSKTNIKYEDKNFINADIINYYSDGGKYSLAYLLDTLMKLIDLNEEKINKVNICYLCAELFNYYYDIYNTDRIRNNHDLKRFAYILDGSMFMIDYLQKQQTQIGKELAREKTESDDSGLNITTDVSEEAVAEMRDEDTDAKETAESVDVEQSYYMDENEEDYAENYDSE